jgi:hypothetical protein
LQIEKTIFFNVFGRLYASNVKLNPMFNVGRETFMQILQSCFKYALHGPTCMYCISRGSHSLSKNLCGRYILSNGPICKYSFYNIDFQEK